MGNTWSFDVLVKNIHVGLSLSQFALNLDCLQSQLDSRAMF